MNFHSHIATGKTLNLRRKLRLSTQEAHDRIEKLWAPDNRFASLETYRAFLARLLTVHSEIGLPAALLREDAAELRVERRRIAALASDLEQPISDSVATAVPTADYAWGVGYVLNGSAIGAHQILRSGVLGGGWPSAYLQLGQEYVHSGQLQTFFRMLASAPIDPSDVLRGAMDTFALFDASGEVRS